MAMDVGGSKGSLKADINVTPLVDVMLVLLIIMMLIAPMLQKGVDGHAAAGRQHGRQAGDAGSDGRRRRFAAMASGSTASRSTRTNWARG